MYPSTEEEAVIQAAHRLMVTTMARYDPSHDAFHVERVRKTALHLARAISASPCSKRPDLLTVELAALLHDVLDKKYVSAANASDPYAFFLPFFDTEKKLREAGALEDWHRECVELHCVQDADRILRCSAYSAITNHPLHTPMDDPAHSSSAIQHFHDKLLHICERLKTEPGKQLAEKRHELMLGFLEAVDEEYGIAVGQSQSSLLREAVPGVE
ncbi:hypothetical protein B0H21DRAFT_777757 [Amylocystis lapponica]|nr:hypothetical protein B0H21DRAFT_777757 [Amylocystis lapponica]